MNILLIEDDWMDRESTLGDLTKSFPQAKIQVFRCVGDFLKKFSDLPETYVLVLEHHLPLLEIKDSWETSTTEFRDLLDHFPWIGDQWNHQEAGEKVIGHVHKHNPNIPILIYTHSDFYFIDKKIRENPKVYYLLKRSDDQEPIKVIIQSM